MKDESNTFMIDNVECEVLPLFDKSLPDPATLDYYNRLSRREIMINSEIDDTCVEYAKQIMEWNKEDENVPILERCPIKIFINSLGGALFSAWSLIDVMLLSKTPIITIGIGCMYSAASMIFLAGHKRYCLPHSTYMIHDGSSYFPSGSTAKMIDDIEFTKRGEEKVKEYFISRTKITPELYDAKYRVNWWMYPEDLIEYSIATDIISNLDMC